MGGGGKEKCAGRKKKKVMIKIQLYEKHLYIRCLFNLFFLNSRHVSLLPILCLFCL
jgi:hypothetical protein